jgi:hypothetical protein
MSLTVSQVKEIVDDPNNRVVTVHFKNNAKVVITSLSYENYTPPYGYKNKTLSVESVRPQLHQRQLLYYTALSAQLANS